MRAIRAIPRLISALPLLAVGLAGSAGSAEATEGPGGSAYDFLNLGASARLAAMGGAGVALAGPEDALSFNPALLARARGRSAAASWYNWMFDVQGGWVGATQPYGRRQAFALGVRSLSVADFENVAGEPAVGASDLAVVAGWGRGLGPVDGGLSLRWIQSTLAEEDATGWSADAGLAWEWVEGWDVASAVRNAGPAFGYGDGADEQLPTRATFGLGATMGELRVDSEVLWENGPGWFGGVGAEWGWNERLFLRSGARIGTGSLQATEPWAAGLGVRVRSDLDLDYSFHDGAFDPSHRIGLRWSPGRDEEPRADEQARSPREYYVDVLRQAVDEGLKDLPADLAGRVIVRPAEAHEAAGVVSETISGRLQGRGLEVEIAEAMPDLPDELDATAAEALAKAGIDLEPDQPVLEYDLVSSKYRIDARRRARWVGPETVDRSATVDLRLRLLAPGLTEPVWTGSGTAEDSETVGRSLIPVSAGYPAAGNVGGKDKRKMHPLVEPAIVGGIVSGLAIIFFSNRDVGN